MEETWHVGPGQLEPMSGHQPVSCAAMLAGQEFPDETDAVVSAMNDGFALVDLIRFLGDIRKILMRLLSDVELAEQVGRRLSDFFQDCRVVFSEIDEKAKTARVIYSSDAVNPDFESIMSSHGDLLRAARNGRVIAIADIRDMTVPVDVRPMLEAIGVRSFLTVPFVRNDERCFLISLHKNVPHSWRSDETAIIEDVASRLFPRLEQVRSDERLRRQAAFFEDMLDSVNDAVYVVDRGKRFVYANRMLKDRWRRPDGEGYGKTLSELGYASEYGQMIEAMVDEVIATGKPVSSDSLNRRDSQGVHWDHMFSPIFDERGSVQRVIGISREVTERMQAEAELSRIKSREAFLSRLTGKLLVSDNPQELIYDICRETMEQIPCDIFINYLIDRQEGCLHLNSFGGITQDMADAIEWLPFGSAVCGCVAELGQPIIATCIQDSDSEQTQLVRRWGVQSYACNPLRVGERMIGTLSFGSRQATAFTEEQLSLMQLVSSYLSVAFDRLLGLRELKQSEQRALALVSRLQESDRIKSEFINTLSHELRNPLASIMMSQSLYEHVKPGSPEAEKAMSVMKRQTMQLTRLVDDLLDVTRINSNKIKLKKTRIELNGLITKAVEDYRGPFDSKGVRLDVAIAPRPVWLAADPARLTQVIGNLINNAVKFTRSGDRTTISVTIDEGLNEAVICVRDTGVGIRPEFIDRLFTPFTQVDTSLDRSSGGLGLGLAIVRGIVQLHDGSIAAHSDGLGKGAAFTVRLPMGSAPPEAQDEPVQPTPQRRHGSLILIIEDSPDLAESLAALLELLGHDVIVANDGAEGIEQALDRQPRIILCDIGLPGMNGYEVAERLVREAALAHTRLIAMSGYAQPEDVIRSKAAGFHQHLAKPVTLKMLKDLLDEELPKSV